MLLKMATGDHERARFLESTHVDSLKLDVHPFVDDAQRHMRFLAGEFDASEFSLSMYLGLRDQFIAIPVFPNRRFRHSFIYVHRKSHIEEPKDLENKRVGLVSWSNTAAVWVRGMLHHEYGVDLTRIAWVGRRAPEVAGWQAPPGINFQVAEKGPSLEQMLRARDDKGPSLEEMLLARQVDAIILPEIIPAYREHHPDVRRLFEDYFPREQRYFKQTGILPISHAVVLRRQLAESHPELPKALWQAWVEAKRLAQQYADDPGHSGLLWYAYLREVEEAVLGPDPWRYNVGDNRLALETFAQYCFELGIIDRPVEDIEALFHPSVREVS